MTFNSETDRPVDADFPESWSDEEPSNFDLAPDVLDEEDEEEWSDPMTDAEADADTLRSAGMGTDEDYGYFGDSEICGE